jgi:hypothetical protein
MDRPTIWRITSLSPGEDPLHPGVAPRVLAAHLPWTTRTLRHHVAHRPWTSRTVRVAREPRKVRDVGAELSTATMDNRAVSYSFM